MIVTAGTPVTGIVALVASTRRTVPKLRPENVTRIRRHVCAAHYLSAIIDDGGVLKNHQSAEVGGHMFQPL